MKFTALIKCDKDILSLHKTINSLSNDINGIILFNYNFKKYEIPDALSELLQNNDRECIICNLSNVKNINSFLKKRVDGAAFFLNAGEIINDYFTQYLNSFFTVNEGICNVVFFPVLNNDMEQLPSDFINLPSKGLFNFDEFLPQKTFGSAFKIKEILLSGIHLNEDFDLFYNALVKTVQGKDLYGRINSVYVNKDLHVEPIDITCDSCNIIQYLDNDISSKIFPANETENGTIQLFINDINEHNGIINITGYCNSIPYQHYQIVILYDGIEYTSSLDENGEFLITIRYSNEGILYFYLLKWGWGFLDIKIKFTNKCRLKNRFNSFALFEKIIIKNFTDNKLEVNSLNSNTLYQNVKNYMQCFSKEMKNSKDALLVSKYLTLYDSFKDKHIWLFVETEFVTLEFINDLHIDLSTELYFVVKDTSKEYGFKKYGRIIKSASDEHKFLVLVAEKIIVLKYNKSTVYPFTFGESSEFFSGIIRAEICEYFATKVKLKTIKRRQSLLFVITQMYKGGAENTLLELFKSLSPDEYEIDFLVLNQCDFLRPTNLLPEIPDYINIIDFIKIEREMGSEDNWTGSTQQMERARRMISYEYDWAFHIGEWWSPEFVAKYVNYHNAAIWLHNDLNLIPKNSLAKDKILDFIGAFSCYIFVSHGSKVNSLKLFPFMEQNAIVIHNLINTEDVYKKSLQKLLPADVKLFNTDLPVLATLANIRPEKKHLRNLQIMIELKKQGIKFKWLNIGNTGDVEITSSLKKLIYEHKLENDFLILGPRTNPYPLIKNCDAVTVLSDVESWSLVITESLSLGIPIIATPTSGAVEQIENGMNGLISKDFSIESIVEVLKNFLIGKSYQNTLKQNIFLNYEFNRGVKDFTNLLNMTQQFKPVRSILYVIDGINYIGGAHKATFIQALNLSKYYNISILTAQEPNERVKKELYGVRISVVGDWDIVPFMDSFDYVVVMSEGSSFRKSVSQLKKAKKIQWIHQHYSTWYQQDDYNCSLSNDDAEIYSSYDNIVLLSEKCFDSFISVHPYLLSKSLAIRNFAPDVSSGIPYIGRSDYVDKNYFNIITIARFHKQKNIWGLLNIARLLYFAKVPFHWYIIGSGEPLKSEVDQVINLFGLNDCVITPGAIKDPYSLLAQMDLFVLFSLYEGTPVTIEEAQLLRVPVVARDLGGTSDMVIDGVNGVLVDGDEMACFEAIMEMINNKEMYNRIKENLPISRNDNKILKQLRDLFI